MLETNTKMVFITAGMGGGTGTGAAPVISKLAKEMDILTVGIVTMPFQFEGKVREEQAKKGIDKLKNEVDALIVINNNKLRDIYGNLGFKEGFAKADEVLATASKGIAEVITHHYTQNIDLKDAKTVLSNSGNAIMGSSTASGSKRSIEAISSALDSPLLNDNRINGAKNVLLLIVSGKEEITIDEIGLINDYIQEKAGYGANIIMGVGEDLSLENSISVTVIATGFDPNQQEEIINSDPKKIIHNLDENGGFAQNLGSINNSNDELLQIDFESDSINFKNTDSELDKINSTNNLNNSNQDYKVTLDINEDDLKTKEFEINLKDVEVISPEEIKLEDQVSFDFDMPLKKQNIDSNKIIHELIEDINEIEVNNPIHIIPVTEVTATKANKSSFDDYVPKSNDKATINVNDEKEIILNPLNSSIADGLSRRTEERKIKLKEYNYNFNKAKNLRNMENEPAFKRTGINFDNVEKIKASSNSFVKDSNREINLQIDKSFLHDNID
jgi:cell division protein FtsZ